MTKRLHSMDTNMNTYNSEVNIKKAKRMRSEESKRDEMIFKDGSHEVGEESTYLPIIAPSYKQRNT
jgi:hypothetical protein